MDIMKAAVHYLNLTDRRDYWSVKDETVAQEFQAAADEFEALAFESFGAVPFNCAVATVMFSEA